MLLHEAKQYLDSFVNYEAKLHLAVHERFDLRRVELLLKELGDPHKKLYCLHVAGSNGKGSTCAFAASILQHLGYKVGLYTSPHLWDIKERIRILDSFQVATRQEGLTGQITEEEFCEILEDIRPSAEAIRRNKDLGELSFFEILTVIAFCYFYQQEADFVVLETGLGGRLDATNVVEAKVCGLTPISLEHTQQLGNTLSQIAKEKAAIIKNKKQHVVIAPQLQEVMQVFEDHCRKLGIQPVIVGKDIVYGPHSVKTLSANYSSLQSPLPGEYQMMNAAMAIAMVEALLPPKEINAEKLAQGIRDTVWPGRFEIIQKDPAVVLDGAHNPAAAHELVQAVQKKFPGKKVIVIFGISADKNSAAVAEELSKIASDVILTRSQHPRAVAVKELEHLFKGKKVFPTHTVPEAVELALQTAQKDDVILITGSLFVVAEARKYM